MGLVVSVAGQWRLWATHPETNKLMSTPVLVKLFHRGGSRRFKLCCMTAVRARGR